MIGGGSLDSDFQLLISISGTKTLPLIGFPRPIPGHGVMAIAKKRESAGADSPKVEQVNFV